MLISFIEAKRAEVDGQRLAEKLLDEEQMEFRKQEEKARQRRAIEEKDKDNAERIQLEEIERFKAEERR